MTNKLACLNHQQNTAYELGALSIQWRELSQKNIQIQTACTTIENHIEELRKEAAERLYAYFYVFPFLLC